MADATTTPSTIAVTAAVNSPGVTGEFLTNVLRTESTTRPDRVGVQPAAVFADPTYTVEGAVTSTGGTVREGDIAFRGLFTFVTTLTAPANGGSYVDLCRWGDVALKVRRTGGSIYELYAEALGLVSGAAMSSFNVDDGIPLGVGLGFTRNATTGVIKLWRSDDGWVTWTEMLQSYLPQGTGMMANGSGEPMSLLGGVFSEAWVQVFQAQWSETDDITAMDANEVSAWNYGANIVTGVGGDYVDAIDKTVKDLSVEGSRASYMYKQRSTVVDGGRTVTTNWTVNVPTLATGTVADGYAAEFVYDAWPGIEGGPGANAFSYILSMSTNSTMSLSGRGVYPPQSDGLPPQYRVILVDRNGVALRVLKNARLGSLDWVLNDLESCSFALPTLDPLNAEIIIPDTEVQVWVGGELLMWCVVVRSVAGTDVVDYQCRGIGWYFNHRIIGRPATNYLLAGSFENGTYAWWVGGYAPTEPAAGRNPAYWDAYVSSLVSVEGTPGRSLYHASSTDMTFGIHSFSFVWHTIYPADDPEGIEWTATAWCYVPSSQWTGPRVAAYDFKGNAGPFGVGLMRASTTENDPGAPAGVGFPMIYEVAMTGIDDDTPKDKWVRLEATLTQPNDNTIRTDWLQVTLQAPLGAVYWDAVTLTRNEHLSFTNIDQATVLDALIQHAQDPAYGKSDLNIDTYCPATGVQRTRKYEFFNHEIVADCINEFSSSAIWRGVDWDIRITPTTRTFTTYFPMKGSRRPAQALILGRNIASVSVPTDGEQVANRVVVMSDAGGTNFSVEEAYATDATAYASGLVLEYAYKGVPGSALNTLQAQAERGVRQYRAPVRIPDLTTFEKIGSQLLGQVSVGDVVPVDVQYGSISLVGEYRIIGLSLDPATNALTFSLNPFEEWNDPASTWGIP